MTLEIRPAQETDEAAIAALWAACGLVVPYNDPARDFRFARAKANSDVLVAMLGGEIAGSVMVGHDGHRGWIYYLAVAPGHRRGGIGKALVEAAERWLAGRGVAKLQLMVRESNTEVVGFYESLGFETAPRTILQKWLNK